ncbi:MAG: hypothetical protein ACK5MP_10635 [Nostocoides sp.]
MTLLPGMGRLNENTVPNVKNTSFSVTARISAATDGSTEGAIISQGGAFGGWALYTVGGKPGYAHNFLGIDLYRVDADEPLSPGAHTVVMNFAYDGGGAGKGGDVTLTVDRQVVATGRVEKTVPSLFSFDDWLYVGLDPVDPVIPDYRDSDAPFTGAIKDVVIDVAPNAEMDSYKRYLALLRKH